MSLPRTECTGTWKGRHVCAERSHTVFTPHRCCCGYEWMDES